MNIHDYLESINLHVKRTQLTSAMPHLFEPLIDVPSAEERRARAGNKRKRLAASDSDASNEHDEQAADDDARAGQIEDDLQLPVQFPHAPLESISRRHGLHAREYD